MTDNAFTMKSWEETLVSGEEGAPRVAHAHAVMRYAGVIDGDSTCDFLLFYPGDGFHGVPRSRTDRRQRGRPRGQLRRPSRGRFRPQRPQGHLHRGRGLRDGRVE